MSSDIIKERLLYRNWDNTRDAETDDLAIQCIKTLEDEVAALRKTLESIKRMSRHRITHSEDLINQLATEALEIKL